MENVIELNRRRVFSKQEAQEILPVVLRITSQYYKRVQVLLNRLESIKGKSEKAVQDLETEINGIVQEWQHKLEKLGAQTKGLWIADFDSGDGYFCWKYPEAKIEFWHRYSDGFSGRVRVDDLGKDYLGALRRQLQYIDRDIKRLCHVAGCELEEIVERPDLADDELREQILSALKSKLSVQEILCALETRYSLS